MVKGTTTVKGAVVEGTQNTQEDPRDEAQNLIENHGIIGDMRSAALVADNGSIDFCCWPDFDSPSIFSAPNSRTPRRHTDTHAVQSSS